MRNWPLRPLLVHSAGTFWPALTFCLSVVAHYTIFLSSQMCPIKVQRVINLCWDLVERHGRLQAAPWSIVVGLLKKKIRVNVHQPEQPIGELSVSQWFDMLNQPPGDTGRTTGDSRPRSAGWLSARCVPTPKWQKVFDVVMQQGQNTHTHTQKTYWSMAIHLNEHTHKNEHKHTQSPRHTHLSHFTPVILPSFLIVSPFGYKHTHSFVSLCITGPSSSLSLQILLLYWLGQLCVCVAMRSLIRRVTPLMKDRPPLSRRLWSFAVCACCHE